MPQQPHKTSLLILSKAFSKSIKLMYKEDCHSILCSTIIRNVAISSVQLRPARKPACSSLSFSFNAVLMRSRITLQNTLLAMFSNIMPRQFLQQLRSPFLGSLISRPFLHSFGIFSSLHILLLSGVSPPALIASDQILSPLAAFPFLSFSIALLISIRVMRPVLMLSSSLGSTFGGLSGFSWLSTV